MTLRRWWSAVSMGKINFPRGKKCIALFVASVLISGHAENQSQKVQTQAERRIHAPRPA
jgi:hypothetical protein